MKNLTPDDPGQIEEQMMRCELLKGLTPENRRTMAAFILLREYEPREHLFFQGDPAAGFYLLIRGKVNIFLTGVDGREQILHFFGPGEMFGEVPVFHGNNYPATAMAVCRIRVLFVPRDLFLGAGRCHPELLLDMLGVLSLRLRQFVHLIDDLSLKEVSARTAKYLLDQSLRQGNRLNLDVSKTALAARLGTIAETLSRTFKSMQQQGVIQVQGRAIAIRDREALLEIAAGMKRHQRI